VPTPLRAACATLALLAATAGAAPAQSLMDRPPNLTGGWVGNSGQLYFNFMHRFSTSPSPERKVSNVPTFTIAAGLPFRLLLGAHYATNSNLALRYPNEWEFFARHALFRQDGGAPLDLTAQAGYNLAAEGVDGEVTVARRQGPVRLTAAARILSDPFEEGSTRFALAGGGTVRVSRFVALAGDVATLMNREEGEEVAWSAGLHVAIPHSPHTLSLHAANTNAYTLQGTSRGLDKVRYGFEFTIPVTLSRWFGGGAETPAGQPAAPPPAAVVDPAAPVVKAGMRGMAYAPARIEIAAGTTVEWKNEDPLAHTVTAADGSFDSGPVPPGGTWARTFTQPGSYDFRCTPHPFMKGVVVVR
jgi:plastocyanin